MTMSMQVKTMVSEAIGVTGKLIQAGVGMARQVKRRAADTITRAADTATDHKLTCNSPGLVGCLSKAGGCYHPAHPLPCLHQMLPCRFRDGREGWGAG